MGLYLVYEQIINYYINKITSGELVAGDALETEEVTAELFEVSRGTVRKALNFLKEQGIIITKRGAKSVVSENAIEAIDMTNAVVSLTHKRICLMFVNQGAYLEPIIRLIKERVRLMGWSCDVLFNSDEHAERSCIDTIIEKKYDGVICTPYRERGVFEIKNFLRLQKAHIPFVLIGQTNEKLFCDTVSNDDYMGSYRITGDLIKSKNKKVVHITDFNMDKIVCRDRENGYIEAMNQNKKPPLVIDCSEKKFEEKIYSLLGENNGAKIGFNVYSDIQVAKLLPVLEDCGLKSGKDYEIICFRERYDVDDKDKRFETVAVSRRNIGFTALDLLKDKLDGRKNKSCVTHVIFNIDIKERL